MLNIFPNPILTSTTFNISLENESNINIRVFNQLGMMVSEIVDEHFEIGEHNIPFNNPNLSTGIYIVKLLVNNEYVEGHKLIVN